MDKNLNKLVDAAAGRTLEELIQSAVSMPLCWYCESPFVREGVCDDCGKAQYNYEDEVINPEEHCCDECENQATYYLKG
jgi:hypothetical protein